MEEQLSDIIDDCLERLEAGASLEECLAAYPQHRQELEELLGAVAEVQEYPWPSIPATTLAAIETRLLEELQTQQISSNTSSTPTPAQPGTPRSQSLIQRLAQAAGFGGVIQPWRRVAAIAIGLVLALLLGTGALAAARAIINTIAPPPTPVPAITQITTGSTTIATVAGTIQAIGPDSWTVRDIVITIDAQTEISGQPQIGAPVTVTGLLRDNGTILAQSITVISLAPISPSLVPTSVPLSTPAQTQVPTAVPTVVSNQQLPPAQPAATLLTSPIPAGAPVVTATVTAIPPGVPPEVTATPAELPTPAPSAGQTSIPTQAPPVGQTSVPTQAPPAATTTEATAVVLPSAVATHTPTPTPPPTTTAVSSPLPSVTAVATATSTPTVTATHTPTPSSTTTPTNTPTPSQTASPTVPPVPTDAFEALRGLIQAGIGDGRAEAGGGQFLLDRLGEAQNAANAGDTNELRRRLHDMRKKTREEMRDDRMDTALGEEILDRISAIGSIYGITIPD